MTFSTLQKIVLASGNPGKIREIQAILADSSDRSAVPRLMLSTREETGSTFVENAILKPEMRRCIANCLL